MSKSLGNGIDPLQVIDQYGADALRLTLITGNAPGNDMRFYWERVEASRNFANKIWNASRFILMNMENITVTEPDMDELETADCWILSRLNALTKEVTDNMENFELGIAVSKIHDFIWDEFCDWYIEIAKQRIWAKEENPGAAGCALWTLKTVLSGALKLLHPYMPFITEEIYCTLHPEEESIMISSWPVYEEKWDNPLAEQTIEHVKDIVKGVRNIRSEMNVAPSRKIHVIIVPEETKVQNRLDDLKEMYQKLMGAGQVTVQGDKSGIGSDAISVVVPGAVVYLPLEELVDKEKERERLQKEEERLAKELKRSEGMLKNEKFLSKAPEAKVQEEREKLEKYMKMMEQVKERLKQL